MTDDESMLHRVLRLYRWTAVYACVCLTVIVALLVLDAARGAG